MRFVRQDSSRPIALALLAGALLAPASGRAQTCVVSAVTMNFGTYEPRSPAVTLTTGAISFRCSASVPVKIKLRDGDGPRAPQLTFRNDTLQYQLFLDPARTTLWGDGLNGTSYYTNAAPLANTTMTVPVFGAIFPGQAQTSPGAYHNTFAIELDY